MTRILQMSTDLEILKIYISPGHNYFGHHGQPAGTYETQSVSFVECVAGHGLRGDRFFDYKEDYKGQVTFFSWEIYQELCSTFHATDKEPSVFRRNIIVRGIDLNTLIGMKFQIQGVTFEGVAECTPCYWMDQAFHPGTEAALQGRGGLRVRVLTDGILRLSS
jgi:MOSC domain-containing protein YiiM